MKSNETVFQSNRERFRKMFKENENEDEKKNEEGAIEILDMEHLVRLQQLHHHLRSRRHCHSKSYMPASSSFLPNSKPAPKNQAEVKDDTNASREEKWVTNKPHFHFSSHFS